MFGRVGRVGCLNLMHTCTTIKQ